MGDEALKSLATTLGYTVTTLEDGRMVLSRRVTAQGSPGPMRQPQLSAIDTPLIYS